MSDVTRASLEQGAGRARRAARLAAVQALYQVEQTGASATDVVG